MNDNGKKLLQKLHSKFPETQEMPTDKVMGMAVKSLQKKLDAPEEKIKELLGYEPTGYFTQLGRQAFGNIPTQIAMEAASLQEDMANEAALTNNENPYGAARNGKIDLDIPILSAKTRQQAGLTPFGEKISTRGIVEPIEDYRNRLLRGQQQQKEAKGEAEHYQRMRDNLTKQLMQSAPTEDQEGIAMDLARGVNSLSIPVLTAVAGSMTGGPALGVTASIAAMGSRIKGSTYGHLRQSGESHEVAHNKANWDAGTEGLLSMVPMSSFIKAGTPIVKKILHDANLEAGQEAITSLLQNVYDGKDFGYDNKEGKHIQTAYGGVIEDSIYSGLLGWLLGGGVSSITTPIANKAEQARKEQNLETEQDVDTNPLEGFESKEDALKFYQGDLKASEEKRSQLLEEMVGADALKSDRLRKEISDIDFKIITNNEAIDEINGHKGSEVKFNKAETIPINPSLTNPEDKARFNQYEGELETINTDIRTNEAEQDNIVSEIQSTPWLQRSKHKELKDELDSKVKDRETLLGKRSSITKDMAKIIQNSENQKPETKLLEHSNQINLNNEEDLQESNFIDDLKTNNKTYNDAISSAVKKQNERRKRNGELISKIATETDKAKRNRLFSSLAKGEDKLADLNKLVYDIENIPLHDRWGIDPVSLEPLNENPTPTDIENYIDYLNEEKSLHDDNLNPFFDSKIEENQQRLKESYNRKKSEPEAKVKTKKTLPMDASVEDILNYIDYLESLKDKQPKAASDIDNIINHLYKRAESKVEINKKKQPEPSKKPEEPGLTIGEYGLPPAELLVEDNDLLNHYKWIYDKFTNILDRDSVSVQQRIDIEDYLSKLSDEIVSAEQLLRLGANSTNLELTEYRTTNKSTENSPPKPEIIEKKKAVKTKDINHDADKERNKKPLEGVPPESVQGDGKGGDAGSGGGGSTGKSKGNGGTNGKKGSSKSRSKGNSPKRKHIPVGTNYVLTDELMERLENRKPKERINDNIEAIKLAKELNSEGQQASPDQQEVLARFSGWGGLKEAFETEETIGALKEILTPKEYESAKRSVQYAHYTSPPVVHAMWNAISKMGFKTGNILEPSLGVGNFFGMMPPGLQKKTRQFGVENDVITNMIARLLYPKADIQISNEIAKKGFEHYPYQGEGAFQVIVGNPPFGTTILEDSENKANLHHFFLSKSIDILAPKGVLGFVISTGFMDGKSSFKKTLSKKADFIGAVRLPSIAFKGIAGTDVTTDVVFFQKKEKPSKQESQESWTTVVPFEKASLNKYFDENRANVLGELSVGGQHNSQIVVKGSRETLNDGLNRFVDSLPENIMQSVDANTDVILNTAPTDRQKNSYYIEDGKIFFVDDKGNTHESEFKSDKERKRVEGMIQIRDTLASLQRAELDPNSTDEQLADLRERLNSVYDNFVKNNGPLHSRTNKNLFQNDFKSSIILGLEENYEQGNKSKGIPDKFNKAKIFTQRVLEPRVAPTKADSAEDALYISLSTKGKIDIPYMEKLTGLSKAEVMKGINHIVYEESPGEYVTKGQLLSGDVKEKLQRAEKEGNKNNIEALREVLPEDVKPEDITPIFGAPWIPKSVYESYLSHILGLSPNQYTISFNPLNGVWALRVNKSEKQKIPEVNAALYASKHYDLVKTIQSAFNGTTPIIRRDGEIDRAATQEASLKVKGIREEFDGFIKESPELTNEMAEAYNERLNRTIEETFEGSHLQMVNSNNNINLRPSQKNAIWRIIQRATTLLDHVGGAGKTFTIAGAAMELKRLGLSKKPMIIVPNSLVPQWSKAFHELYPSANIISSNTTSTSAANRQKFLAKIKSNDWDSVIISHSAFKLIGLSDGIKKKYINEEINIINKIINEIPEKERSKRNPTFTQIQAQKESLESELEKLLDNKDKGITFDDLDVDSLFVDESHNYKNLKYVTKRANIKGMGTPKGSDSALDLYMKTKLLHERGNKIIFATGTPISNSITEMYTIMRYLDPQWLKNNQIESLDAWLNTFTEPSEEWSLGLTGKFKSDTYLSKFKNLKQLVNQYRSFADIITTSDINQMLKDQGLPPIDIPALAGGKPENVVLEPSKEQQEIFDNIIKRAEAVANRGRKAEKGEDNMLSLMTMAKKAALDVRMVDPDAPDNENSRVNVSAKNIKRIYDETNNFKGTQLVFLDMGVPNSQKVDTAKKVNNILARIKKAENDGNVTELDKANKEWENLSEGERDLINTKFSVYDALKKRLVDDGIPEDQIAFIQDYKKDAQRAKLFNQVKKGEVRVLIGSSQMMGAGMDVQDRMKALHHLDVPYRPSDLEQREWRILRQGNSNDEVNIFRYATNRSLDSKMWDIIERKAGFIESLRRGDVEQNFEDISMESMNAAEMKAAASGDPRFLEIIKLDDYLRKLIAKDNDERNKKRNLRDEITRIESAKERTAKNRPFIESYIEQAKDNKTPTITQHEPSEDVGKKTARKVTLDSKEKKEKAGKFLKTIMDVNSNKEYPVTTPVGTIDYPDGSKANINIFGPVKYDGGISFAVEVQANYGEGEVTTVSSNLNYLPKTQDKEDPTPKPLTAANAITLAQKSMVDSLNSRLKEAESFDKDLKKAKKGLENIQDFKKQLEEGRKKYADLVASISRDSAEQAAANPQPSESRAEHKPDKPITPIVIDQAINEVNKQLNNFTQRHPITLTWYEKASDVKGLPEGNNNTVAVFIPGTDNATVALIKENISTKQQAVEALRHEVVGHYGFDLLSHSDRSTILDNLIKNSSHPDFKPVFQRVEALYPDKTKYQKAEEVFARLAEKPPQNKWWDRIVDLVKRAFAKIGFPTKDINSIIRQVQRSIILDPMAPYKASGSIRQKIDESKEPNKKEPFLFVEAGEVFRQYPQLKEDIKNLDTEEKTIDFIKKLAGLRAMKQQRGHITIGESKESAERMIKSLGMTPEKMASWNKGKIPSAAQLEAMASIIADSYSTLREKSAKAVHGSQDDILAFMEQSAQYAMMISAFRGAVGELGRSFRQFQDIRKELGGMYDPNLTAAAFGGNSEAHLREIAKNIANAKNPREAFGVVKAELEPTWNDKAREFYISALLSGIGTHTVNITSNFIFLHAHFIERYISATFGKLKRDKNAPEYTEINRQFRATIGAASHAMKAAVHAFKTESYSDPYTKVEGVNQALPGTTGRIVRIPLRALSAMDAFFKESIAAGALEAEAYRLGRMAKMKGSKLESFVKKKIENPTDDMKMKAIELARELTFTKPLGPTASSAYSLLRVAWPVIPFYRTPVNLMKETYKRTPLAYAILATPKGRQTQLGKALLGNEGGTKEDQKRNQNMAHARVVMGTGIMLMVQALIDDDDFEFTGAMPKDPKERGLFFAEGKRPYSVKMFGRWYNYGRLEPIGSLLGLIVDANIVADKISNDKNAHIGELIIASISNNLVDKTYLAGFSDAMEAFTDPSKHSQFFPTLAANITMPITMVRHIANIQDPYLREARSYVTKVIGKIPYVKERLPERYSSITGKAIVNESAAWNSIMPFSRGNKTINPVITKLAQLTKDTGKPVLPSYPSRSINGHELNSRQYAEYSRIKGTIVYEILNYLISNQLLDGYTNNEQAEIIKDSLRGTTADAKDEMMYKYPQLMENIE